jgi:PAS domain S-box-containing protein
MWRLEQFSDDPDAIIYIRDLQGRYVWVNDAYERLLPQTREQVIGRTNREVFGDEAANWEAADGLTVATDRFTVTEETQFDPQAKKHRRFVSTKTMIKIRGVSYLAGISIEVKDDRAASLERSLALIRAQLLDAIREDGRHFNSRDAN